MGQVTLRKGVGPLLAAMALMPTAPIQLDIVGDVQIAIPETARSDRRIVFHGQAPRSAVHDFYRTADLFMFPTLSDGFGLTQLEALSWGVPVMATPFCGAAIQDRVNGRVLNPVTPQSIAQACSEVLENPTLLTEWARGARTSKIMTMDGLAGRLLTLGRSICA